jgi:hypothetical protein
MSVDFVLQFKSIHCPVTQIRPSFPCHQLPGLGEVEITAGRAKSGRMSANRHSLS